MTVAPAPNNHPVYLLAEHLDMILAAIEDLEAAEIASVMLDPLHPNGGPRPCLAHYVNDLRHLEGAAILRVSRARDLTRQLVRRDARFAMLGGLFVAGTAALDEAVRRMADASRDAFVEGVDPMAYLRARGVIAEDVGGLAPGAAPRIDGSFRLAGEIETRPLVDLVSTFLNTIELHFDLFPDLVEANDVMPVGEAVS